MAERILKYYTFPDNNAYGVSIPVSTIEAPIAAVNTYLEPGNQLALRVTVGWNATKYGEPFNRTDVLFRLWRGAPITGKLISSAKDSAEPRADSNKIITFSQYEGDFANAGEVTYTLTAQTLLAGSLANIIGGLTFTALIYK